MSDFFLTPLSGPNCGKKITVDGNQPLMSMENEFKQAFISLYAAVKQFLKNNNKATMRRLELAVEKVDEIADRCPASAALAIDPPLDVPANPDEEPERFPMR
jgi:hypothetical protein